MEIIDINLKLTIEQFRILDDVIDEALAEFTCFGQKEEYKNLKPVKEQIVLDKKRYDNQRSSKTT